MSQASSTTARPFRSPFTWVPSTGRRSRSISTRCAPGTSVGAPSAAHEAGRRTVFVGAMAALVIAYLAFKVRLEEKLLAARYPEYPSYRKRTWGLLPGWRG